MSIQIKIKVIQDMQYLRNLNELRGLQRRLVSILEVHFEFIKLCTLLMKKGVSLVWNDTC